MTITASTASADRRTADPTRNNARAGGIFYLITFAASLPALLLIGPVLNDAGYITSAGQDTRVLWGCLLDFVNAVTCIGSAVAVYPVVKRRNESMALGFVTSRMLEAAVIMIGVVSLLAVVTLRQNQAGDVATGQALVAVRDWTFLFGPGFMATINAVLFGTLLYRSRLVPRIIPTLGLIGAPLLLTADMFVFFGHISQTSVWSMLATLPVAAWELSVGVYMTTKGFRRVQTG
ncbi:DUF4386 domain-containing protein [Kribbella capetownensis]|uniref:DUF4386 domain-containing protein n=1 Tax=Kribbella capetownensis TaxID=1572659 RepID=A0A4R0JNQ3_9ACTN|nr:DUF4386 domain-containing protein [Kribbella capetownensis]TCC48863.1 DUF4386 domain-containing protein [Kribbella capetownensis]